MSLASRMLRLQGEAGRGKEDGCGRDEYDDCIVF